MFAVYIKFDYSKGDGSEVIHMATDITQLKEILKRDLNYVPKDDYLFNCVSGGQLYTELGYVFYETV